MKKVEIRKKGSWLMFFILLLFCFPLAILYWLFKMKKEKIYRK